MDSQCLPASSFLHPKIQRYALTNPIWKFNQQQSSSVFFKSRISNHHVCACQSTRERKSPPFSRKTCRTKAKRGRIQVTEEAVEEDEKKGTITGAVALIIGTTIGSGILALPQKASPAGVFPSSISMILCWAFLLIEALLLIEINVGLRKKRGKEEGGSELEVISIRTMAQETLGDWGGTLATVTYIFLGYTSMIAYSSKSGEILFHLINLPRSVSSCFFTALFTILISVGGTQTIDQVNQWLTASMIGLLVAIEILGIQFGGWSGSVGSGDWGKVPATIPVMIFSLVYHDIAPVLCAYLGGDLKRLRASVLLGSLVPLFTLLVWDAVALGLSAQVDQVVDPVQLLMRVKWSGFSYMVEAFSLLAVGTSLIGTLLSFSEFIKEQLKHLSLTSPSTQILQEQDEPFGLKKWWERNNITFTAMAAIVGPTLLVSTSVPDAFSAATDIAGGYCMTMLYGVLPPAMAWATHRAEYEDTDRNALSRAKPALFGVGLFACGIVAEQILWSPYSSCMQSLTLHASHQPPATSHQPPTCSDCRPPLLQCSTMTVAAHVLSNILPTTCLIFVFY